MFHEANYVCFSATIAMSLRSRIVTKFFHNCVKLNVSITKTHTCAQARMILHNPWVRNDSIAKGMVAKVTQLVKCYKILSLKKFLRKSVGQVYDVS